MFRRRQDDSLAAKLHIRHMALSNLLRPGRGVAGKERT
jgi:hypothetical protein